MYFSGYDSPLGNIIMASNGKSLTGLWFEDQKDLPEEAAAEYREKCLPVFDIAKKWLDIYFSGEEPDFLPPVLLSSTPFRMKVWEILKSIPYGKTVTYKYIADLIAEERGGGVMSAQAVGGAVGHNPVSIIVPCHRVVGTNGKLVGYAGGLERKQALLAIEKGKMK